MNAKSENSFYLIQNLFELGFPKMLKDLVCPLYFLGIPSAEHLFLQFVEKSAVCHLDLVDIDTIRIQHFSLNPYFSAIR